MASTDALFQPLTIRNCTIRNRVMSTSHAPSYGKEGLPQQRYQLYYAEKAKGGIGLTSVGGSSSVSADSPAALWNQLDIGEDRVIPFLQEFSERIHGYGAKIFCQITHMGRRTRWDAENWMPTVSSSPVREPSHRAFPKEMEDWDIRRIQKDYAAAAARLKEGGFDGVEILIDSHLPGQFWSPVVNRRTDGYGGSTANRSRFTLELFEQVRRAIGDDMVFGMRFSGDEMLEDGIGPEEAIALAKAHVGQGCIDYLNVNCGNVYTERALANLIPNMSMPVAPYLYLASQIRREIGTVPIFHAGRIPDVATAARAVEEGHVDMVAMTRAHIADPHLVNKLREGRVDDIRQCIGAGYCIDRIYTGGDAICIQNPATGREATLPHIVEKGQGGRKVVVVGGGPAGLEAARVSAERGNQVVLFERAPTLGGQITVAGKADWREGLNGITRWLQGQVRRLHVDIRLGTEATLERVQAQNPDLVVIATGGHPNLNEVKAVPGHVVSTWDILNGTVAPGENVLLFDDHADHHGPSVATFMAKRGSKVEVVTPERKLLVEVGMTNFPHYLRDLYKHKAVITPDTRLTEVYQEGNKLIAVLLNEYSDEEEERVVDQVVIEHGTLPNDELYFQLRPASKNLGRGRCPQAARPPAPGHRQQSRGQLHAVPRRRRRCLPQHPRRLVRQPPPLHDVLMSSTIVVVILAGALAWALLGVFQRAARWSAGKPAKVDWLAGLLALPRRYLINVHHVVARDRYASTMHVMAAGGFVAAFVLLFLVHIARVGGPVLAWPLLIACFITLLGVERVLRRRTDRPPRLSGGRWNRFGWAIGGFALSLAWFTAPAAGLFEDPRLFHPVTLFFTVVMAWSAFELADGLSSGPMRHALAGALNLVTHPRQPRFTAANPVVGLHPIDLTDPKLGVETPQDFAWNRLVMADACVACGRCEEQCPAFAAGQPLDPKFVIQAIAMGQSADRIDDRHYPGRRWPGLEDRVGQGGASIPLVSDGGLIPPGALWACTTCRACVEACPMMIEHLDAIIDLRRFQTLELGAVPGKAPPALAELAATDNIHGRAPGRRMDAFVDLELPRLKDIGSADLLLWLGDGAFDPRGQRAIRAFVQVARHAGVKLAVLGEEELDTGDLARRLGDEAQFQRLAKANVAMLARYRFNRIVTTDPHVLNSLRNDYPEMGGHYTVVHHTSLLLELAEAGLLQPSAEPAGRPLTYHDPCYLGRWNGEFEAPRRLLDLMGVSRVEMARHGKTSRCCGGGGGATLTDIPGPRRIPDMRMNDVRQVAAAAVVVACPTCAVMLDGVTGERPEVTEIAELVLSRLAVPAAKVAA